ncbi:MAG: response regulator [Pirellulaceae bacterium]|nr:response regulator [Pirellulaceae bacterium]
MEPTGSTRGSQATAAPAADIPHLTAIVGIGASAGGLEALEKFFDHVPADTGLAYVVVQHLSPDFKSLMDELLSRHTPIPIHRVTDGMLVQPDAVYLLPPKKEMIITQGRLLLMDKDPAQSLTLPIDTFFRSLAQDAGDRAVAVVLSGTGSDGSRGIRAIHDAGGLVIVQDPYTAKFDGMPKSALDTGTANCTLAPEAMPATILANMVQPGQRPVAGGGPAVSEEGMTAIFRLLRDECGIDFSNYKQSTVLRRVERRLQINQSLDLDDYVQQLRGDRAEVNSLYRDLLIGVTEFFRDAEAFERLERDVIPALFDRHEPDEEFRVWVAGCATGEEAYSLAILLEEALELRRKHLHVRIFATDVHRASLEYASTGVYESSSVARVSPERLRRFFTRKGDHYHVSGELRKSIVFAPHNVLKDAPFTKLNLISCRNLLIYFQPLAQKKVLSLFHFGLRSSGILFLGPSESPGEMAEEFEPIDVHWKIFRKRRDVRLPADLRLPLSPGYVYPRPSVAPVLAPGAGLPDMELLRAYDALLDEYVPPSLLLDAQRRVLHTFAGAGRFLVPQDGRMTHDVLDMVDRELRLVLAGALQRAARDLTAVTYTGVRVQTSQGQEELKLRVKPVTARQSDSPYMLVSFENTAAPAAQREHTEPVDVDQASRDQMQSLEVELRYTKENLQATIEELETSNEELQATNEELVASNEELQSTNEELHSVNEELYTVNAEYQRKIAELTQLTNDMDNLLQSTDVGTIFLDRDLCIRKFTPRIAQVFHILPQDVGRRIDSFATNIQYDELVPDLERVLHAEVPTERQVCDRQGHWYLLRILPYRLNATVTGVVITLIDVDVVKATERELNLMSKVFMDGADPIIIEDLNGNVRYVNDEAVRVYGWPREELVGNRLEVLVPDTERHRSEELRRRCRHLEPVRNVETVRRTKSGTLQPILLTLSLLTDERDKPLAIASIAKDITDRKQAEMQCREAVQRRDQFLAMLSHELRNPLGAVINATYLLERNCLTQDSCKQPCAVIDRQSQLMARLLDDLLDVSRVMQGKIDIRLEPCDLRKATEAALEVVRPQIEGRDQELLVDIEPTPLIVNGDFARLQQIQVNLLHNAMKYTPAGGTIWLNLRREDGEVVLRVRDSGEGIPVEMLQSVFDLFVQAGGTLDRAEGGMGVGLTLVHKLVELHGGTVAAYSAGPGTGSEFVVRLPVCSAKVAPKVIAYHPPKPVDFRRILIVEDNADSREMLRTLLEIHGYDVEAAEDGRVGLSLLERKQFDMALVDIGLPGIDGYEVARRIRRDPRHSTIRLVALTGYGRTADREAVEAAGFDEHFVKPLDPQKLTRLLARTDDSASSGR